GITAIMTRAICYVLHKRFGFAQMFENSLDDMQIGLRSAGGDVVGFTGFPFFEGQSDGAAIVFDEEPIPLLHPVTVDRKSFVFARIRDDERNQLFGKLEGTIVVGTTENDRVDAVGVGVSGDEMIGGSLARSVRTAWV